MTTATTCSSGGASAGAKAANHECFRSGPSLSLERVWAVPVLPAACTAGVVIATAGVPSVTV